jgi:hypothetical protein
MPDPHRQSLGQWAAHVEQAPDYDAYLERLEQVPGHWRDQVIRHCQTVAAVAQAARERQVERDAERTELRRRIGLEP